jgi:hypothetical protein
VPVWLALQLHKRNKARILLPEWLSSKQLSGGVVTFMQWQSHQQASNCPAAASWCACRSSEAELHSACLLARGPLENA